MRPEMPRLSPPALTETPWARLTVVVWTTLIALSCATGALFPHNHNTFPFFRTGGLNWLAGMELYQQVGESCRYSPLFHVFMIPLSVIPEWLGNIVWRLLNVGLLVAGIRAWIRHVIPRALTPTQHALLFLLPVPLAFGSLHNGQANLMMVGLMLLSVAAMAQERYFLASLWVVMATLLKLYPLTLALLLLVIRPRRFLLPLMALMALGLVLPFLFGTPDYVLRQCGNWVTLLRADYRLDMDPYVAYRDLWLLCRIANLPISHMTYHAMQALSGLGIAVLCALLSWQRMEHRRLLNSLLAMVCIWIALLGPATESCTYVVIAPTLAWALVVAWEGRALYQLVRPSQYLLLASFGLFVVTLLAGAFPRTGRIHAAGLHPVGGLLLVGGILCLILEQWGRGSGQSNQVEPGRQAA